MTKLVRWVCPVCHVGKLAPSRPRKNDTRRYCLPCSGESTRLVERVAPALETKRQTRRQHALERAEIKREKKRAAVTQPDLPTMFRCGTLATTHIPVPWLRRHVIEVRPVERSRGPRIDGHVLIIYDHGGDLHDARAQTVCAVLQLIWHRNRAAVRLGVERLLHVRPILEGAAGEQRPEVEVAALLRAKAAVEKLGLRVMCRSFPLCALERAEALVTKLPGILNTINRLDAVLDEAQNSPPQGRADGTIPPKIWAGLRRLSDHGAAYSEALADVVVYMGANKLARKRPRR